MVHHHHHRPGEGRAGRGPSPLRALRIALLLTTTYLVVEFLGGLYTGSLALIADAGHMLVDAAALGLSLFALWCAGRPATEQVQVSLKRIQRWLLQVLYDTLEGLGILQAGGVVYSSKKVRRAKDGGGGYVGGGWVFPIRRDVGKTWTIVRDGGLRIAAFNSNYSDNAGSYEVKFSITRS